MKKPSAGIARVRTGTADTGAQLTVINEGELSSLGVKNNSIFPVAISVNTVTKSAIDLIGGIFLRISASDPHTGEINLLANFAMCLTRLEESTYQRMHVQPWALYHISSPVLVPVLL